MIKHHEIKTELEYYQAAERGEKNFEVRKNDRDYKKHDIVTLVEVKNGKLTGRKLEPAEITYIVYGGKYGIDSDYCVMQLKR